MEQEEIWRDIPGYEGHYQASNLGRIKSVARTKKMRERVLRVRERVLAQPSGSNGYLLTHLCKGSVRKLIGTHRLVAMAFLNPPHSGWHANHLNGIKTDNRLVNLEVTDAAGNVAHAIRTGLAKRSGPDNPNASVSLEQVAEIRRRLASGEVGLQISREMNVGPNVVYKIKKGRTHRPVLRRLPYDC